MGDLFSLPENSEEMEKYPQVHREDPLFEDSRLVDDDGKYVGNMYFEDDTTTFQSDMDVKPGDTIRVKVPRIKDVKGAHRRKLKNRTYIDANQSDIGPAEESKVDKVNKKEGEFVYLGSNFGLKLLDKEPHKNLVMENWDSEDVEVIEKTGHQSPEEYIEKWKVAKLAYGADYINGEKDLSELEEEEKIIPEESYKKIMRRDIEVDEEEGKLIYHVTDNSETVSNFRGPWYGIPLTPDYHLDSDNTGNVMKAAYESLKNKDLNSIEVRSEENSYNMPRVPSEAPGKEVAKRVATLLTYKGEVTSEEETSKMLKFK